MKKHFKKAQAGTLQKTLIAIGILLAVIALIYFVLWPKLSNLLHAWGG